MENTQVAIFKLKDYVCGIDTFQVYTILRCQNIEKTDKMPEHLEGIIEWRDTKIPVINLASWLGLNRSEISKHSKIFVINTSGFLTGFLVDNVRRVIKCSEGDIEPAPPVISNQGSCQLKAVGRSEGELIPILDFEKFLTRAQLEEFHLYIKQTYRSRPA